ncbi:MAG: tetratricopeptide repeat protein [Sphingobium sp.]
MKAARRSVAAALCVAVLAGGLLPAVPAWAMRDRDDDTDLRLNAYARARMAEGDRALLDAISAYRDAIEDDPSSIEVAQRSYRQAVLAGDKMLALKSAHSLDEVGLLPRDGTVLLLIDAIDRKNWKEAALIVDRLEAEENLAFLVPFMRSWLSLEDKPYDPPVVPLAESYASFAVRYLEEQLLLQRLVLGDAAGAREAYTHAVRRKTAFGTRERWMMAARFMALDERGVATSLLEGAGVDAAHMDDALRRARKLYRKARITPLYGLALLMHRLAIDLSGQTEGTAPMSIARMASFADPGDDDIRIGVARTALLAGYADTAFSEAGLVEHNSPAWLEAQSFRMRALLDQGKEEEAVEHARALKDKEQDSLPAWRLLGDVLIQAGDYEGAATAYGKARDLMGGNADAALLLQWGGALEQAGQWEQARPLLEQVVERAPDSAVALNHLGYALADRGEDLPRAISLLEKANRLRPHNAAFIDSLGWAYYRNAQYDKALPLIRSAVAMEPGNPELNDHHGDILWAMGRHFEARYAWKAALISLGDTKRDDMLKTAINAKIAAVPEDASAQ